MHLVQLHPSGPPTNNAEMVANLTRNGDITTPEAMAAFSNVDRGHFIDLPAGTTEETRFRNNPFRNGIQHLSAPGIYATALEALELREGLSFLNVCSGTGYLSALASQILGKKVRRILRERAALALIDARNLDPHRRRRRRSSSPCARPHAVALP